MVMGRGLFVHSLWAAAVLVEHGAWTPVRMMFYEVYELRPSFFTCYLVSVPSARDILVYTGAVPHHGRFHLVDHGLFLLLHTRYSHMGCISLVSGRLADRGPALCTYDDDATNTVY